MRVLSFCNDRGVLLVGIFIGIDLSQGRPISNSKIVNLPALKFFLAWSWNRQTLDLKLRSNLDCYASVFVFRLAKIRSVWKIKMSIISVTIFASRREYLDISMRILIDFNGVSYRGYALSRLIYREPVSNLASFLAVFVWPCWPALVRRNAARVADGIPRARARKARVDRFGHRQLRLVAMTVAKIDHGVALLLNYLSRLL